MGPANEQRMQELTEVVYERYLTPNATFEVNLSDTQFQNLEATFTQQHTGATDDGYEYRPR